MIYFRSFDFQTYVEPCSWIQIRNFESNEYKFITDIKMISNKMQFQNMPKYINFLQKWLLNVGVVILYVFLNKFYSLHLSAWKQATIPKNNDRTTKLNENIVFATDK